MNREDHLIYRSVKFEKKSNSTDPSSLTLKDNNLGEDVKILKMTQRYDIDPWNKHVDK